MGQNLSIEPIKNGKKSKSVSYHVRGAYIPTDPFLVKELHRMSAIHPSKNIRFLFHDFTDSPLHIMLIKEAQGFYYPTHVHNKRHEVHYLIEGVLALHILHPDGTIRNSIISSVTSPGLTSVEPGIPHVTIPMTNSVVYLEIKNGPSADFESECFMSDLESEIGSAKYQEYLTTGVCCTI